MLPDRCSLMIRVPENTPFIYTRHKRGEHPATSALYRYPCLGSRRLWGRHCDSSAAFILSQVLSISGCLRNVKRNSHGYVRRGTFYRKKSMDPRSRNGISVGIEFGTEIRLIGGDLEERYSRYCHTEGIVKSGVERS